MAHYELTQKIQSHRAWRRVAALVATINDVAGVRELADTLNEIERALDHYNRRSGSRFPLTFGEVIDLHDVPNWSDVGCDVCDEPFYSAEFLGHTYGLLTISPRSGRFVVTHARQCPDCGQWHSDPRDTTAYDAALTCCLPW